MIHFDQGAKSKQFKTERHGQVVGLLVKRACEPGKVVTTGRILRDVAIAVNAAGRGRVGSDYTSNRWVTNQPFNDEAEIALGQGGDVNDKDALASLGAQMLRERQ
jgi:hypothetical protein